MLFSLLSLLVTSPEPPARVTVFYDAFSQRTDLVRDWGFAALVEYNGLRILFDTGDNPDIFARNAQTMGIDLGRLDFAVVSHRHGDHTAGLSHLLKVNPAVKIYAPREGFGVFGYNLPGGFWRQDADLPARQRYYGGEAPDTLHFGTAWPTANFTLVDNLTEVAPGVFVISTVSQTPGTLELHELSLAISTPQGLVVIVGCSHPGIEKIVAAAQSAGGHVHLVMGGFHLVNTPDAEIERVARSLRDHYGVDLVAPGHCTGEPAFAAFSRVFGPRDLYAGLGEVLALN